MTDDTQMSKLEDLCRLCLEGPGCVDIFKTYLLSQNIQSCTGVEVQMTDKLPKSVCRTCFDIVNRAYRLRLTAAANDKHLRALLNTINYLENESLQSDEKSDEIDSAEEIVYVKEEIIDDKTEDHNTIDLEQNTREPSSKIIKVRSDLFDNKESKSSRHMKASPTSKKDVSNKCSTCGKTFLTRKKLYLHDRLHNKIHACTTNGCDKKFATKGDLNKHIRTHTGEKPYMCCICEKNFAQSGTLKTHLESHLES
ncbi:zinc finger protein 75A-like [Zerene cesonia]|uniref:zinc finger protein 75A-like n=1 Tax=Zerene cesonia TaxID=33412 RepID=UPI0018E50379|nr:zinc finger protein 75A-like [Zerene cesonia]